MELRHLLNIATEESKCFEDMSTINGEKLLQSEKLVEVLQSELKCAHDRLGTVEKELEKAGLRENEIPEKLQSIEEQLEQNGRALELANTRVLDLEACHESVANAFEMKLQEATASLNLKESEANELKDKLVSLKDQTTVYQVLATKATGEVVSMKAVLEDNAMRIITLEKNLEELRRKISESEAKSEQFIFENDAAAYKNSKLQEELVAYQSKVNELNELLNTIQAEKERVGDLKSDAPDFVVATLGSTYFVNDKDQISTIMEESCLDRYTTREHQAVTVLFEEQIGEQKTVDMSKSSSNTGTWEITTSRPQKNQEVLQLSECKHVILPGHFEVSNLEISGLSFGNFNAGLLRDTTLAEGSTLFSDSTREVEEISLRIHDETPTAHGEGRCSPSLATGEDKMMLPAFTEPSLQERVGGLKSDAPDSVAATLGSTSFANDKDQISTVMEDNCLDRYTTREHQAVTVLFGEQIGEQKTVDMSKSSSNTMTWEITTSRPQENQEVLQLSECKHVILPTHFEVPNLEISGLSFGNFNAGLLSDTTLAKGSAPFSDLTREVEENSLRIHDGTPTAHGEGQRSPYLATVRDKMMLPAITELSLQESSGGLKSHAPDSGVATEGSTFSFIEKTVSNMGLINHEDQHAKMKLIAMRRAQELQQEEEERKRMQKAKSLAKLEELQRKTWKESSHEPKVQHSKYLPRGVSQYQWRVKVNNNH